MLLVFIFTRVNIFKAFLKLYNIIPLRFNAFYLKKKTLYRSRCLSLYYCKLFKKNLCRNLLQRHFVYFLQHNIILCIKYNVYNMHLLLIIIFVYIFVFGILFSFFSNGTYVWRVLINI